MMFKLHVQRKATRKLALIVSIGIVAAVAAFGVRQDYLRQEAVLERRAALVSAFEAKEAPLRAAVAAAPNDPRPRLALAEFYAGCRLYEPAAEQLTGILSRNPDNLTVRLALANMRFLQGRNDLAEQGYGDVTRRHPQDGTAWKGLAAALFRQGRYLESVRAAQEAVRILPKDPDSHYALGLAQIEYALEFPSADVHADVLKIARAQLTPLLQTWPGRGDLYYLLGRVALGLRDNDQAILMLKRAAVLLPGNVDVTLKLARAFVQAARTTEAEQMLKQAMVSFPDNPLLADQLSSLLLNRSDTGSIDRALELAREAASRDPGNELLQEHLGTAYLRANRIPDARAAFEHANQIEPTRSFPLQQLAAIYNRMGDTRQSTLAARAATQMVFNDQELSHIQTLSAAHPESVALHLILADRYSDLKWTGLARDEYLVVLQLDPGNRRAADASARIAKLAASSSKT